MKTHKLTITGLPTDPELTWALLKRGQESGDYEMIIQGSGIERHVKPQVYQLTEGDWMIRIRGRGYCPYQMAFDLYFKTELFVTPMVPDLIYNYPSEDVVVDGSETSAVITSTKDTGVIFYHPSGFEESAQNRALELESERIFGNIFVTGRTL